MLSARYFIIIMEFCPEGDLKVPFFARDGDLLSGEDRARLPELHRGPEALENSLKRVEKSPKIATLRSKEAK